MPEWLVERGIGETRAALVDGGAIVASLTRRDGELGAGDVVAAKIVSTREGVARLDDGRELSIVVPTGASEGALLHWRVNRSALPERDLVKRARAVVTGDAPSQSTLLDVLAASGVRATPVRVEDGALDAAGWSELVAAAESGVDSFPGGVLRIEQTAAFVTIDIDGEPSRSLASAGAVAAARTARRWGIGGQIVVDLPREQTRAERRQNEAAIGGAVPDHFSAIRAHEGGLLHHGAPRAGVSLLERARFEPVASAALGLLRTAQRARGTGELTLVTHPAEVAWLEARPTLIAALERGLGRAVRLRADRERGIGRGDVH